MAYTKDQAQERLRDLQRLMEDNENYAMISAGYMGYFQKAADSLQRRLKRGDFDQKGESK